MQLAIIDLLGFAGGLLGSSSLIAQVVKTLSVKSAKDFSWLMLGLSWLASSLIFIYAILIHTPAIYITIFINLVCFSILLGSKYKFEQAPSLSLYLSQHEPESLESRGLIRMTVVPSPVRSHSPPVEDRDLV